jgi:branched-chain amino acid transport system permease protein
MFVIQWAAQRFLITRVVRAPLLTSPLLTYGVSLPLTGSAHALFTNDFWSIPFMSGAVGLGELALSIPRLVATGVAHALTAATRLVLRRIRWGKALRATFQSADVALACGIDIDRARMIAFGIAVALVGAPVTLISAFDTS